MFTVVSFPEKSELSIHRHRDADTRSLTNAQGETYHRAAPEPITIPPAVARKLDNQNKTASIRSRTSAPRLTTVELDDLFARQASIEQEPTSPHGRYNMANGNVVVPAQNRPTPRSQQQDHMTTARSQPDTDRVPSHNQQEDNYAKHITRVDIGEPASVPSPGGSGQHFDFPDHRYSNGSAQHDNIYAVPSREPERTFDYARSGVHLPLPSSVIPPPPALPAPQSPSPTSSELVEINTNSPAYANVSGHIQMREKSHSESKEESPYESSFRPGKNARLSKTPADLPVNVQRSRHSSSYSGSGSGSEHSDTRQTYSPHKHVMAYEKHSTSSESSSDKQSVTVAENNVREHENRIVQDHPDATVLMTSDPRNNRQSDGNAQTDRNRYYEPTPDYDQEETDTVKRRQPSHEKQRASREESSGRAKIETEVPPVRSLREQWQKRDGTSPGRHIPAATYQVSERQNSPSSVPASTPAPVTQKQSFISQKSLTRPQARPPAPPSPAKEEHAMSAFGNAIKEAAMAREKRAKEQEERETIKQKEKEEKERQEAQRKAEQARQEAEKARQEAECRLLEEEKRQASPAPPPPPPAVVTAVSAEFKKSHSPPPHIQKQLEESRKREQSHNQLMAAIAKRRNYIDSVASDNSALAIDIDSRIERNKNASPARVVKADQQNIELVKESTPPKPVASIPPVSATSSRRSSLKREAPQPPSPVKPTASVVSSKQEEVTVDTAGIDVDNFTARAERARQEWLKKKQAGTAIIENPPKPEEPKKNMEDEDNNNVTKDKNEQEKEEDDKEIKPPKAPEFVRPSRTPPRDPKAPSSAERAVSPNRGGLGDLASIIAQKALQRQKTYEGDIEKEAGGPRGTQVVYGSQRTQNTNLSKGNSVPHEHGNIFQRFNRSQSTRSVEITGATLDSSNTEAVCPGQEGNNKSVLERTKMFESQTSSSAKNGSSYSVKSVTRATTNGNRTNESSVDLSFDLPPPLVVGNNKNNVYSSSVSSNYDGPSRKGTDSDVVTSRSSMNGNETVGWVINSSPPQHSHEYAVRRKLASRNGLGSHTSATDISHSDDVAQMALVDQPVEPALADIVEVEVIPPPPLFDTDSDALGPGLGVMSPSNFQPAFSHEDNASMVSSLSTLSTLSSNEHDNQFPHDSGHQSHIQTQFSSPSSGYHSASISQSEDLYSEFAPSSGLDVAPPPPGFDDCSSAAPMGYVDLQQEHHYEELSTIQEFIPPPCGFDVAPPFHSEPATSPRRNILQRSSLRHRFENKNITDWSVDDVADWLVSLNLSTHKQTFIRHQVTGQNLTQMGRNELIVLGVTQVGDRMNIERAVKRAVMN